MYENIAGFSCACPRSWGRADVALGDQMNNRNRETTIPGTNFVLLYPSKYKYFEVYTSVGTPGRIYL